MNKICTQCGLEKDINDFYENPETKDGHSSMCKECQKKISMQYVQQNKEKIKQYKRERYLRRKKEFAELKRLVVENGFDKRDN